MTATNQTGSFAGKVAFITGAGSGMGRTTALAFAREGASVVLADVSDHGNQDTARMIEEFGGRALAVRCDVTRSEHVQAALNRAVGEFGRLDVAFNNAGAERKPSVTVDVTEEEWDRIIAINLRGVFLCMKYEIPLMLQHGGGAIVNNSSGALPEHAPTRPAARHHRPLDPHRLLRQLPRSRFRPSRQRDRDRPVGHPAAMVRPVAPRRRQRD
jgi:NAD(P)-dependent dehydrogenase (short-subunit alcohol dehydrogenase family)